MMYYLDSDVMLSRVVTEIFLPSPTLIILSSLFLFWTERALKASVLFLCAFSFSEGKWDS